MRRFRSKSGNLTSKEDSSKPRKMSIRKSMSRIFNRKKKLAEEPVLTVTEEQDEQQGEYQHLVIEKYMPGGPDEVYDEFLKFVWQENAGLGMFSSSYVSSAEDDDIDGKVFKTLGVSQEVTASKPGDFIEYEITEGPFPVSFLKGRVNFIEGKEDTTKLEWIVDFQPIDMGILNNVVGESVAENIGVGMARLMITNVFPYLLGRLQDKLRAKHGSDGDEADNDVKTDGMTGLDLEEEDSEDDEPAEEVEIDITQLQPAAQLQSGYTGHLTSQQKEALEEFRELCKSSVHSKEIFAHPDGDDWLLRFLRAECKGKKRKFQVQKSFKRFEKTMAFRKEMNALDMLVNPVKGFDEFLEVCGEHVVVDKHGRPVVFTRAGPLSTGLNTKLYTSDVWKQMITCLSETRMNICRESSKKLGHEVSAAVVVYDLKGTGMGSRKIIPFVKVVNEVASTHYPEFVDQIILCNAPSVFSFLWNLVKNILDPVTREKVKVYSYSKKETEKMHEFLRNIVEEDKLPKEYGGASSEAVPQPVLKAKSDYY